MEASGNDPVRRGLERPPLANGEAYTHDIDHPKGMGPTEPWWDLDEVAAELRPQIQEVRAQMSRLSAEQLGADPRIVLEAETLPNFLAASHFPGGFFDVAGLIPIGSRASTGTRRHLKIEDEPDQLAKTYLLSADQEALIRLESIYGEPNDLDGALRTDALKFSGFSLEGPGRVLKMGRGEVPPIVEDHFAFEAVMHPQLIRAGEVDPVAGQRVREEFTSYVASLGGTVNTDYARLEGTCEYLPLLLPRDVDSINAAAAFTQVRIAKTSAHPAPKSPHRGKDQWNQAIDNWKARFRSTNRDFRWRYRCRCARAR